IRFVSQILTEIPNPSTSRLLIRLPIFPPQPISSTKPVTSLGARRFDRQKGLWLLPFWVRRRRGTLRLPSSDFAIHPFAKSPCHSCRRNHPFVSRSIWVQSSSIVLRLHIQSFPSKAATHLFYCRLWSPAAMESQRVASEVWTHTK
ncbi:unnamed protein product, partial [Linum tenue]